MMQNFDDYFSKLARRSFCKGMVPHPRLEPADMILPRQELDVEIGCGVGLHPVQYALQHPDRQLIAIEHTREKFQKFQQRIAQQGRSLPNLYPVHANAISWISHKLGSASVSRYFLLYPNPYPKSQHRNRRWYAMPFMSYLLETLIPGGSITLATNLQFYADEAYLFFTQFWGLKLEKWEHLQNDSIAKPSAIRTHFEKKYLERGQRCHNLVFRKM